MGDYNKIKVQIKIATCAIIIYIPRLNMYLLIAKIFFASGIFLLTIVMGFIPLKIAKHNTRLLSLCDAFASGVFLSTALLHLLPDAVEKFDLTYKGDYPVPYLICIITYITFLVMERGIATYKNIHLSNSKFIVPSFLVALLAIHSLVEGAAIGVNTNLLEAMAIFLAVFAHKSSESFALTVNLNRFNISTKAIKLTIFIFALMTPLGILIASYVISASATNSGSLIAANLNAIAAGTFLYLGVEHLIESKTYLAKARETMALLFGVVLIATVAIWV